MAKDAVMSVRATQAFRERLRQEAQRRGMSLSELMLTAALRELGWGDRIRVYEDDEPIEKIQQIRTRPPGFVTDLPQLSTLYVVPSPSGDGTYVQQVGPMTWASGRVQWRAA